MARHDYVFFFLLFFFFFFFFFLLGGGGGVEEGILNGTPFAAVNPSKFKDRIIYFRNAGVKGLILRQSNLFK